MKRAMVAFGGNALIKAGEPAFQAQQIENAKEAAEMVVKLVEQGLQPILVHGNGPQVGNILIQQEEASNKVPPYTMDICGAETQGAMGYMLERCIINMLKLKGITMNVASVLTEVVVDGKDAGFRNPTKPVGPFYEAFRARNLEMEKGWVMREDSGRGWRRLVPSPRPLRIVQADVIKTLADAGNLVIAGGGGGIPVVEDAQGFLIGVEAVIDKDRTAAMIGDLVGVSTFINLTGVSKVAVDFGKPSQRDLDCITVAEARKYLAEGQFPPGSMGPKIEAAVQYIEMGGEEVLITNAESLLHSRFEQVGTRIVR